MACDPKKEHKAIDYSDSHGRATKDRPQIWRNIKGQQEQGQQDREPLRGKSASERVSERTFKKPL